MARPKPHKKWMLSLYNTHGFLQTSPFLTKETSKKKKTRSRHFGGCHKTHSPRNIGSVSALERGQSDHLGAHVLASLWVTGFISTYPIHTKDCPPVAMTYFPFHGTILWAHGATPLKENLKHGSQTTKLINQSVCDNLLYQQIKNCVCFLSTRGTFEKQLLPK